MNGQDEAPRGQRYGTRCCSLIDGHDDANQYTVSLSSNDYPKIRELMYILAVSCWTICFKFSSSSLALSFAEIQIINPLDKRLDQNIKFQRKNKRRIKRE